MPYLYGESFFGSQLKVKGLVEGDVFENSNLKIEKSEVGVFVKRKTQMPLEWNLMHDFSSIEDYSYSFDYKLLILKVHSNDAKIKILFLRDGKPPEIKQIPDMINSQYSWIQDIGAISSSGKYLLSKCSKHFPQRQGSIVFNYQWVILDLSKKTIEIVEDDLAICKWRDYMEK